MSYLVRMIEIANWSNDDGSLITPDNFRFVKADGITKDLKTGNNMLSLWEIHSLDELKEMAISLLTSKSSPQDLFIIAIPKEGVEKLLELENNNDAETAFKKFQNRHYDLLNMDLEKLQILSKLILEALQDESRLYDFIYIESKNLIKQLIDAGEIDVNKLKGKIQKDLKDN